jgi:uncharacterized protein involved in type VI secretion and phage assembly
MSPSNRMQGVVIGLVVDVRDPEGIGRIKVQFPWMPDSPESHWARVAVMLAGPQLGAFFQPEVGDEALVAFEMGDPTRPFIIGYLWSGNNTTPVDDPNIRIIHTVSGHKLTFDDTSGSEKVMVEDKSGSRITLDSSGVTIESSADVIIKGQNVTIEADLRMELKAASQLTAKGNPIHLNP